MNAEEAERKCKRLWPTKTLVLGYWRGTTTRIAYEKGNRFVIAEAPNWAALVDKLKELAPQRRKKIETEKAQKRERLAIQRRAKELGNIGRKRAQSMIAAIAPDAALSLHYDRKSRENMRYAARFEYPCGDKKPIERLGTPSSMVHSVEYGPDWATVVAKCEAKGGERIREEAGFTYTLRW